jgi:hypothetical protein
MNREPATRTQLFPIEVAPVSPSTAPPPANVLANRNGICQPSKCVFSLAADPTGRRR